MMGPVKIDKEFGPAAVGFITVVLVIIVVDAVVRHHIAKTAAYFAALAIAAYLIRVLTLSFAGQPEPPVHSPRLETAAAGVTYILGITFLAARFIAGYQAPPGIPRLLFFILGFGSAMNVSLAVFLVARRYGLSDLGIRFTGVLPAAATVCVFATIGLLTRSNFTLAELYRENGSTLGIIGTALMASIPEEFFRFVWQTRIAAWRHGSHQAGWIVASSLWALLHAPIDWSQSHNLVDAAVSVINIVPLGLLWGYLTFRTRSIGPAILVHATNIWGLQNLP
jgi:membrane protease YdiL (CAAX protease family)